MGALRAAELAPSGMVAVGRVQGAEDGPTVGGIVVEVVPKKKRHAANALLRTGQNTVRRSAGTPSRPRPSCSPACGSRPRRSRSHHSPAQLSNTDSSTSRQCSPPRMYARSPSQASSDPARASSSRRPAAREQDSSSPASCVARRPHCDSPQRQRPRTVVCRAAADFCPRTRVGATGTARPLGQHSGSPG
ncbi:hypothetical protein ABZ766_13430 [Streptomyces sp. NPDC006670]|uniref:hypothetical protein n=1 Tax=Streptomyces sp. NPDC006670 TaxID=3154476 RepID=UPI0033DB4DB0